MNRFYCEKEMEVIEALRRGPLQPDLAKHAASCDICADTLAVSEFLQSDMPAAPALPDSGFLWWKAQLTSKQTAMERATRSIMLARKAAYLGACSAALWLALTPGNMGSIVGVLSNHAIRPDGQWGESALVMMVGALLFTLAGSLYLAREK